MSNFTGTIAEVLSLSHCVSDSGVYREHAGGRESTHLHWKEDHVCSDSPRIIKKGGGTLKLFMPRHILILLSCAVWIW